MHSALKALREIPRTSRHENLPPLSLCRSLAARAHLCKVLERVAQHTHPLVDGAVDPEQSRVVLSL